VPPISETRFNHLAKYNADDGLTDSGVAAGGSGGPSDSYNVNFSILGQPLGGSVTLAIFVFTEAVTFASNWSGSRAKCKPIQRAHRRGQSTRMA
jgi:hypothetical protein